MIRYVLIRAVSYAAWSRVLVVKHVGWYTFRHVFAEHVLESGYAIRTIQELLGHKDVSTAMICTHVLRTGGQGARSLADTLRVRIRQSV